ncbi:hypothetical protein BU23DRAFT_563877 [Bimuria novae-zelandiae CBS 107.79]|uniref:Uncharacterized protein n=1 Tax=Bimuria novae-zelandiae CBS 107.79 TaxID=1447943 RepID=A0A6A5W0W6_9PLEO|nr:hypothetical protein BU23DRAFT_563877 [Bimuria novae-zelandiae CBS 107.79]
MTDVPDRRMWNQSQNPGTWNMSHIQGASATKGFKQASVPIHSRPKDKYALTDITCSNTKVNRRPEVYGLVKPLSELTPAAYHFYMVGRILSKLFQHRPIGPELDACWVEGVALGGRIDDENKMLVVLVNMGVILQLADAHDLSGVQFVKLCCFA